MYTQIVYIENIPTYISQTVLYESPNLHWVTLAPINGYPLSGDINTYQTMRTARNLIKATTQTRPRLCGENTPVPVFEQCQRNIVYSLFPNHGGLRAQWPTEIVFVAFYVTVSFWKIYFQDTRTINQGGAATVCQMGNNWIIYNPFLSSTIAASRNTVQCLFTGQIRPPLLLKFNFHVYRSTLIHPIVRNYLYDNAKRYLVSGDI